MGEVLLAVPVWVAFAAFIGGIILWPGVVVEFGGSKPLLLAGFAVGFLAMFVMLAHINQKLDMDKAACADAGGILHNGLCIDAQVIEPPG